MATTTAASPDAAPRQRSPKKARSPGAGAFGLVERVRSYSPAAANALLNRVIPWMIPLAGGLEVRVREVTDSRCEMTMPLSRRTRNHVGSMYIGAQMTLADLTVGVLLFRRFPPGPFAGLIRRVEADFVAKAKGTMTCICELPADAAQALDQVRTNPEGKSEAWVPLRLQDSAGKTVTELRVLVAIKRF
jgi:acyl-coenzyme A thioesterase PaaI-like protein